MDLFVLALLDVVQTVGLVPALWEHIEGDLTTNRVGQIEVGKLLLQSLDKVLSDIVSLSKDKLRFTTVHTIKHTKSNSS